MPPLLSRYILVELLKVIALTTVVLVTVIAFGAAVKPLANNALLDVQQTLKYVLLATVPMLQFALPFAAGFAGTIVLHRCITDNEVLAMSASGISYRQIVTPIAALGIVLTIAMIVLTQTVIPRFWQLLEHTIVTDVTELFQASINRGQPFQIRGVQIYAQEMVVEPHPAGTTADARMQLWRVAAAELDDDGRIEKDVTASRAIVDLYRREGQTILKLKLLDAVAYSHDSGELVSFPEIERDIVVPSALKDDPKLMSRSQLLQLRSEPDRYRQVRNVRRDLAVALESVELRGLINEQLRHSGTVLLRSAGTDQRRYEIDAARLNGDQLIAPAGRAVEVRQVADGRVIRIFRTDVASIQPAETALSDTRTLELTMQRCVVQDPNSAGPPNQREQLVIPALRLPDTPTAGLYALTSAELLARAAPIEPEDRNVARQAQELRDKIAKLNREIDSRLQKRHALSLTALLLLLLGSSLAMWLRQSLPLTIYLLAFLPSVLDLLMISSGEQMLRDGKVLGGVIIWGGTALMAAVLGYVYMKLKRN